MAEVKASAPKSKLIKVVIAQNYYDKVLERDIKKGEELEVTPERARVLKDNHII